MKNLFTIVGFFAMIILVGGLLHQYGFRLTMDQPRTNPLTSTDDRASVFSDERPVAEEIDIIDPDRHYRDTPAAFDNISSSAAAAERRSEPATREKDIERWVRRQGPVAVMEAVRQGVPAGISLAIGVLALERGQIDVRADFNQQIIEPLATYKESRERSFFKYSANSDSWVTGLDKMKVYNAAELKQILRRYDLAAYDAEVYLVLQNKQREQSSPAARRTYAASVTAPAESSAVAPARRAEEEVADEKLRANMAYAMNRLVDNKLEEKGASMKFKAKTAPAAETKTQARRVAESIRVGESKRFTNPTEFQNVLREVLALEAGYSSWADYRAADASGSKRAFLRRGDLMANGGKMIVERRK